MILVRIMASIVHCLERKFFVKVFCEVLTISNLGIPLYLYMFEKSHEQILVSKFMYLLNT